MNHIEKNTLIDAVALHLDTRDKRFMFLACTFPQEKDLPARVILEGRSIDCATSIVNELIKNNADNSIGKFGMTMNHVFGHLDCYLDNKEIREYMYKIA